MLQLELKEAQANAVLGARPPMQTALACYQNSFGEVLSFVDDDLFCTVLRDLWCDKSTQHEIAGDEVSTPPSKVTSTASTLSTRFANDLLQGRSKNMAMLEVAKVRAAQLAKKGQQCVDLAGELASWNSKYQCLEDRFELKERELRVAGERAKEGRWQSKINFAMLRARESKKEAEVAQVSSKRELVITDQFSTIKELQTKLMNVTLLMAEKGIDTFDLGNSNSTSDGPSGSDSTAWPGEKVTYVEEKPSSFFSRLMWP